MNKRVLRRRVQWYHVSFNESRDCFCLAGGVETLMCTYPSDDNIRGDVQLQF
jgi:hypothetical protein